MSKLFPSHRCKDQSLRIRIKPINRSKYLQQNKDRMKVQVYINISCNSIQPNYHELFKLSHLLMILVEVVELRCTFNANHVRSYVALLQQLIILQHFLSSGDSPARFASFVAFDSHLLEINQNLSCKSCLVHLC